jgi:Uma2 family endonuclease
MGLSPGFTGASRYYYENGPMSGAFDLHVSPEEYLAFEEAAQEKHEYWGGRIHAMAGAAPDHVLVATNITVELGGQMKGRPCRVYTADLRTHVASADLYAYPDVAALCGRPLFGGPRRNVLLNPQVLVEVLSESTAAFDRGWKWEQYQKLESLTDYLLVAQDRRWVEHYTRTPDGAWAYRSYSQPEDVVEFASLGCHLALADVYDKVELSEPAPLPFPTPGAD